MNLPGNPWSFGIGRIRGVEIRIHILLPLLALIALYWVQAGTLDQRAALLGLAILTGSVALHELIRVITVARLGGHTSEFVLAPIGGCSRIHLTADPPAHLVAALVGPMTFLGLMIASACGLALGGDRLVHHLLFATAPPIDFVRIGPTSGSAQLVGQLIVWLNWILLLVSLLPIDPSAGAELLRGVLWPIVGRNTAISATSHIALGSAILAALLAILLIPYESPQDELVRVWLPLAVVSCVLLYGGMRNAQGQRYDHGLAIDEFDSDDEEWLMAEWIDDDREAVLVEHLPDKQQEALDRKRREQEATEDARVDAILLRLHNTTFEQLSEEDRSILKRASRRYRDRQNTSDDHD